MLPQEEECPVAESLLGALYRSSPEGLATLVETIPTRARARLAIYCYRRAHLSSLGMTIASSCELTDLLEVGGDIGLAVFTRSRQPKPVVVEKRPKISLHRGAFSQVVAQDLV
jgi:hypothetical protein